MANLAHAFFTITKADEQPDGTLMVYGKATDDSLDIDQQICDADWLKEAMPEWFETGGNIREQHSSIAAGVATELEEKNTGWWMKGHIVDPVSVLKVKTDVLKGFSVGIKNPRVIRDVKAVNGRIVGGQIVEISLVDRPANPTCQLVLAKSVKGQKALLQVEDLIEKGNPVRTASEIIERAKEIAANNEIKKFDAGLYEAARNALAQLVIVEAQEMVDGHDETFSLNQLMNAITSLMWWYEREEAEGETQGEAHEGEMKMGKKEEADAEADAAAKKKEAEGKADAEGDADAAKKKEAEAEDDAEAKKEAEAECSCKCEECQIGKGCDSKACKCVREMAAGMGEQTSGMEAEATLEGTEVVEPKSAEQDSSLLTADEVEAIVEKAVKSAVSSVRTEVDEAIAAKEAEFAAKAASYEQELAKAKALAVGGGPKRTAPAIDKAAPDNLMVKAAVLKAKMNATNDPDLKKGYAVKLDEILKTVDAQLTKSL